MAVVQKPGSKLACSLAGAAAIKTGETMPAFATGPEAFQHAKRKAHYGHRTWIVWQQQDGTYRAEYGTFQAMKEAILSVGVYGKVCTIDGTYEGATWRGWRQLIHLWRTWRRFPQNRWIY